MSIKRKGKLSIRLIHNSIFICSFSFVSKLYFSISKSCRSSGTRHSGLLQSCQRRIQSYKPTQI